MLLKKSLITLFLSTFSLASFAVAPVYDVDNFPPSFDGQPDTGYTHHNAATTDQRLKQVEQKIHTWQQINQSAHINSLQHDIQTLRGQVEELTHQLEQMQTQQKAIYSDNDKRLNELDKKILAQTETIKAKMQKEVASEENDSQPEKTVSKSTVSSEKNETVKKEVVKIKKQPTPDEQPNVAEEQQVYQNSYQLIKARKYHEAIHDLKTMLAKYPKGQFAANAHYWLGELYGLTNKTHESAKEFALVIKEYPENPRVPDAQLKLGFIYAGEAKWPQARASFNKVINQYPGSASAHLASEQLKQIKLAGH